MIANPCRVYLVQHGEAQPKSVDPARPLTERGRREAERVAAVAARMGLDVWQIRHSGKTRAEQTAKIFGAVLNPSGGVVAVAGLAPADDAKPVAEALAREERPIMIVGHKPFLAALAGLLVAEDPDRPVVEFRYAAIVCLTRAEDRWLIAWILTPEMAGA